MSRAGKILGVFSLVAGAAAFGSAFTLDIDSGGTYTRSDTSAGFNWAYFSSDLGNTSVSPASALQYMDADFVVTQTGTGDDAVLRVVSGTFTLYTWDPRQVGSGSTLSGEFTDITTSATGGSFSGKVHILTGTGSFANLQWLLGSGGGDVGTFTAQGPKSPFTAEGTLAMTAETAAVPEPFTIALCAGALGLALRRRVRKA